MRLGTILFLIVIFLVIWLIFRGVTRENFFPNKSVTVHWAPNEITPQDIAYNWGVCITGPPSTTGGNVGRCANQTPAYPPGNPGPGWDYKGQTARGATSLVLDNSNCLLCNTGQILHLQLQSVNLAVPSQPKSAWTIFTIDLSSSATVVKNSISDSTNPNVALYPGSTGFTYVLQLNQPAFVASNDAIVSVNLSRNGVGVSTYTTTVPYTSMSPDGTTGVYTASFLTASSSAPWSPSAPGPLQQGDVLTVTTSVTKPGTSSENGDVYFIGTLSQAAVTITPSAPTGVIWNIE